MGLAGRGYPTAVENPYRTAAGIILIALGIVAGAALVVALRTLLVVVLTAGVLALALDHPVSWVHAHFHLARRGLAVAIVCLLALGAIAGFAFLLYQPFLHQSRVFRSGLPPLTNRVRKLPLAGHFLRHVDLVADTRRALAQLPRWLGTHRSTVLGVAESALTALAAALTVAVTAVFLLLKGPTMLERGRDLILDDFRRARAVRLGRDIRDAVSGYVNGNLLISLLAATVTAVSLLALRVPFVAVLAAVMFVLDLIPLVGASLGGLVVTAATFVLDPHPWKAAVFAVLFIVYQELESHTLYPWIMGHTVRIGSFGVFLVTLAGAELGGIVGALLAIPVGAALNIALQDLIEERRARAEAEGAATRLELELPAH
ncbi:MAG TPA: AI-2E family transporter [Actinomycetota bacterium]|nr:AI-2E family transporter [Actinomycetota bacterium]